VNTKNKDVEHKRLSSQIVVKEDPNLKEELFDGHSSKTESSQSQGEQPQTAERREVIEKLFTQKHSNWNVRVWEQLDSQNRFFQEILIMIIFHIGLGFSHFSI